jgi:protein-export membrane protein SecD
MGIAVDANVLIFERVKEELRGGKSVHDAVAAGFSRAWFSIRDSNISNFITALILFWFGTSLIKGFALTLGMGVLVSLFSAITITRIFLSVLNFIGNGKTARFLFSSGLSK